MDIKELRFAGRDGRPCVPGEPIDVHLGGLHAGTVDPVPLSLGGSRIHVEHYTPAASEESRRLHRLDFARISLLGVTAYVAEHFWNVTTISFMLDRDIEGAGGGMRLAGSRSALMQSIGAENVLIAPRPEPDRPGQFVVSATWRYNQQNVDALHAALETEWKVLTGRLAHAAPDGRAPRANEWLRRFLQRRRQPGGGGAPG